MDKRAPLLRKCGGNAPRPVRLGNASQLRPACPAVHSTRNKKTARHDSCAFRRLPSRTVRSPGPSLTSKLCLVLICKFLPSIYVMISRASMLGSRGGRATLNIIRQSTSRVSFKPRSGLGVVALGSQTHARTLGTSFALRATSSREAPSTDRWEIKVLYDGDCPLCMKEVTMRHLRRPPECPLTGSATLSTPSLCSPRPAAPRGPS